MKTVRNELDEREQEVVSYLIKDCKTTGEIQTKLKRLFAGTIERMLEGEMDVHLGYEKNSIEGNNSGNSRNGYSRKRIISDYGECEIAVPRDRNGEFKPQIIEKRRPFCQCSGRAFYGKIFADIESKYRPPFYHHRYGYGNSCRTGTYLF